MNKKMTKIDASLDSKKANAKKRRMGAIAATVAIATGAAAPVVWAINPDEADAEEGTEEEKKIKRAVKNIQENGGYDWEVIDKLLQQFHEKYIELKQHDNSLPAFEQFLSEYFEQYETEKNNLFSHEKNTESDFQLRETVFNYLNDKAESIGISLIS
jgi:hypothetical protein